MQGDEVWAFCYCKQKRVTPEISEERYAGDAWTWAAIDADTKLAPCWTIGRRDPDTAKVFVSDLAGRLADRIQLTSDGLRTCLSAVAMTQRQRSATAPLFARPARKKLS